MTAVTVTRRDGVLVLSVDYPPVNALSLAVRTGLAAGIAEANADPAIRGIVIRALGKTFVAGADIKELAAGLHRSSPTLREIQQLLERGKPSVAAIHGTALGGGLELALTCRFRVAVADARVGLPEVKLGLLPGGGGTQRLARLCGPDVALDLCLSGRQASASEALALGIVDALVEDLDQAPVDFLLAAADASAIIDRSDKVAGIDPALFDEARNYWRRKARGRIAPAEIIDCIEAACRLSGEDGLAYERAAFQRLFDSEQHHALIHAFLAEREAAKLPGTAAASLPPIERAGVVGAGLMGAGIAVVLANAGLAVTLLDIDEASLQRGRERVVQLYAASTARGAITAGAAAAAQARIAYATDYAALGEVDLAIEAAPERMELKQRIFRALDAATPPHAILATNTSSLDVDAIAAATGRPEQVIGLHFFSPANIMKLVEVVRGAKSSTAALAAAMALAKRLGKVSVLAGNYDGFIANRTLQFYTGQAEFLMEQGAAPEHIDRVAEAFGMPMGPVAMRDMAGLDVAALVRKVRALGLPPEERLSPLIEKMVEAGRLGQKTKAGFYRYEGRDRIPDPAAQAIIDAAGRDLGVERRSFTDEEIRDRLFLPIVNEGARALEDGTALRAGDVDVAWINGYGFPAYRGGPMYWGIKFGLQRVIAMSERLGRDLGPRWRPSPLLVKMAATGQSWRDAGY
ncbi:3-hydroxyacyl-CoA dehydrogenase NAD-binding domain-containing protein [Sphingosinicella sp. LY1275]|uniref:3-hydroxyacyl-CoA dehydrogenase NAD-binding domain-containing protein n=1 Tax=Sphingosinicella sp. LY1275 TaxID=3095379 RepID=UPI002ADEEE13|nr:3-hydroxyacyl-CoA dehydrogenase NAD-binding domain-containing protein [Sphingosinicella sp. LY1275]MEA1015345.1 3-hydroxyacyl-CoA dehydrogenase NAD-binding domain-containing protein [Sphingosinicella sp. LY1275]